LEAVINTLVTQKDHYFQLHGSSQVVDTVSTKKTEYTSNPNFSSITVSNPLSSSKAHFVKRLFLLDYSAIKH